MEDNKKLIELCEQNGFYRANEWCVNWQVVAKLMNEYLGENNSSELYRGRYRRYKESLGKVESDKVIVKEPNSNNSYSNEVNKYTYIKGEHIYEDIVAIADNEKITPESIMQKHHLNSNEWVVVSFTSNVWQQQTKDGTKINLCQSKLTVKPKAEQALTIEDVRKALIDIRVEKPLLPKTSVILPKKQWLIPCFFDVHFGKLADKYETGENYDYKIARERVINNANGYLDFYRGKTFEKLTFVIGNDFFNSGSDGNTFGGTRQDNDTRPFKMFKKGLETVIQTIYILSELSNNIDIVLVQGNHDFDTSYYLAVALEMYYKDCGNIIVNSIPNTRKYIEYGCNLVGFTHGSEEGKRLSGLMQYEAPEEWGRTSCREWLIGHKHIEGVLKLAVEEENGVVIRNIPSLTGTDAWHKKVGFTMARKKTIAFIYDYEKGLTDQHYENL